jgi:uncharacterized MnhB-related membrane protein
MKNDDQKRVSRKLLKTFLLLLSSLLIITATASVLNAMYMQASLISAETAEVQFVTAADSTAAGASVGTNGTYVMLNGMAGWPNSTRTYQAAVGIQNFDTAARTIELKFDQAGDWSGDTANIDSITVIVRNSAGGTQRGSTITVGTAGSSTGAISIPASTTWVVEWSIKWAAGALSTNTVAVTLTLTVTGE